MKKHNPKSHRSSKHNQRPSNNESFDQNLDDLAQGLMVLSRKLLPDGVLPGAIKGFEEDMRQEAIILALGWYMEGAATPGKSPDRHPWIAPRAMSGALKIVKRDMLKMLKKRDDAMEKIPPTHHHEHPAMVDPRHWHSDAIRWVNHAAIRIALKAGKITEANAAVAQKVLVDGVSVTDVADKTRVHRSNIYQHLSRVRKHLPSIIDSIEIPLNIIL